MEKHCELSIVIPCLNEEQTLAEAVRSAQAAIQLSGLEGEVVVADNGSTDGSVALAERAGARVAMSHQKGYGNAVITGVQSARGRFIVMGDADATYDFRQAVPMIRQLEQGYDLVMGSRLKGTIERGAMPWAHRWVGTPVLTSLINRFFGLHISDCNCGLRAFTRSAFDRMRLVAGGMEFASEMIIKSALCGLKVAEVPCSLARDRRQRKPHLRPWRDGWRHLRFILLFAPHVVFAIPGWIMFVSGVVVTAAVLPGPLRIGHRTIDYHLLFYSLPLIHLGYQSFWFQSIDRRFARFAGLLPAGQEDDRPWRLPLEAWLIIGVLLAASGVGCLAWIVKIWVESGFGSLSEIRLGAAGMSLVLLGVQTLMNAMLAEMMHLKMHKD